MKNVLTFAAIGVAATGLALLIAPSLIGQPAVILHAILTVLLGRDATRTRPSIGGWCVFCDS